MGNPSHFSAFKCRFWAVAVIFFIVHAAVVQANSRDSNPQSACSMLLFPLPIQDELFHRAYHDPALYRPGWCGPNIRRLIKYFEDNGVPASQGEVLFLLNEMRYSSGISVPMPGPLYPDSPRGRVEGWRNYHAVLMLNGRIFDLDLSLPKPLPASAYFNRNFPPEHGSRDDRLSRLTIQVIPAREYLEIPNTERDYSRFPKSSARQYLNTLY